MSDEAKMTDETQTEATKPSFTHKQTLFIAYYVANGGNATKAALDAGYSPDTAHTTGWENLQKPEIKAAIADEVERTLKDVGVDKVRWLTEVRRLAYSDIRKVAEFGGDGVRFKDSDQLDDESAALIESVESAVTFTKSGEKVVTTKVKLHSKKGSLDTLGKFLKMLDGDGAVGVKIVIGDDEKDLA